jgi:hypothetical protein
MIILNGIVLMNVIIENDSPSEKNTSIHEDGGAGITSMKNLHLHCQTIGLD